MTALDRRDKPLVVSLNPAVSGPVYEKSFSSDACTEQAAEDVPWGLYEIGEPLDTELLLPMREAAHGAGRIRNFVGTIDSVVVGYVAGYNGGVVMFDSERDEPCVARRMADGDWLCLPESVAESELYYYRDAACQNAVVKPGVAGATLFVVTQRNFCVRELFADEVLTVHALGAPYAGALYTRTGSDCTLEQEQAEAGYFELGAAAADTFPPLIELTEH